MADYDRLKNYLTMNKDQPGEHRMTFAEVEALIGPFPAMARSNREWWTNNSTAQAKAWYTAGWQVRSIDLEAEEVLFKQRPSADQNFGETLHHSPETIAEENQPSQKRRRRWPWMGWSESHPAILALWIAVISGLIVSGTVGVVHLFTGSGNAVSAVTVAERVAACVHEHHMSAAAEGPIKPSAGTNVPFASANGGRFTNSDPIYGSGLIPVSLFESCSWPPANDSDATGYGCGSPGGSSR